MCITTRKVFSALLQHVPQSSTAATKSALLICLGASVFCAPSAAQAQSFLIYGGSTTGTIYAFDPVAKTSTLVFDTGFTTGINGLAWNQATERLYFTRTITNPGDGGLYYWNRRTNTLSAELLTTTQLPGDADNGAIFNSKYWYVDGNGATDTMYSVDLTTLAVTPFTNWDGTARTQFNFGDLAIDSNGKLYGSAANSTTQTNPTFFSSSIVNNAPSPTGYQEFAATTTYQLAFSLDEKTLYGAGGAGGATSGGSFFTIDKTSGAATQISGFSVPAGVSIADLASTAALLPTPAPPGIVSGLIGVGICGAQFGIVRVRRRRRAAKDTTEAAVASAQ